MGRGTSENPPHALTKLYQQVWGMVWKHSTTFPYELPYASGHDQKEGAEFPFFLEAEMLADLPTILPDPQLWG